MSLHADAAERLLILDATTIHLAVNRTCNPTVSAALVAWTHDSGVDMKTTLSASSITTNRTDKPLIMQAQKRMILWQKCLEIFGWDGLNSHKNQSFIHGW